MNLWQHQTKRQTVERVARILGKLCGDATVAALMNATLSADAEPCLSDSEVEIATLLFDAITDARPDCIELASPT